MTSPSPPLLEHPPYKEERETPRFPAPQRGESGTHEHQPASESRVIKWSRGEKWLLSAGIGSGTGVGTLGLASSYRALEDKAAASAARGGWGWGEYAWMLPVGVDLGILTFSIINLLLVKAEKPLAWVKWVPRALTIVTIVLNWSTGATLQGKLGHAALAALWVVLSEIAAHLYAAHIGRLKGRRQMERIRFSRWVYQPVSSFRVNRLMKSWEITSYEEALERDRHLMVYRSGLRSEYGRRWRFKATEEKLQPLRLAAYGMTIEHALEEPDRQETAKDLREQKRDLQRAQARLQRIEAESQVKAAELQAEAAEVRAQGELEAAKAEADAAASVAVQQAEADLQVRRAQAEAESRRLAAEAEAKVKELETEDQARQDELARQREKDQLSWDSERAQLLAQQQQEERRREREARQLEAEDQLKESADAARARRIKKDEDKLAAQAEKEAAEARAAAVEADLKAEQDRLKKTEAESRANALERKAAEDSAAAEAARLKAAEDALKAAELEAEARLTSAEREARKVADMIRQEGLEAIKLMRIEQTFGVSQGTASGRRKRAIQLLQESGELPAEAA
ncbi:DUF2637 domain-containing protein [Streptomyces sp. WAC05858]|uniref:DUF2637 domain-containing protein n=1 Tax=Streptomyces TaxID=1883 RepID=UPI000F781583|nr:DUF2637 domain-containing protein [Streptomyces sp. WAC05858]RSS32852.1 DUF2637 domain-containing protein [Streptomyces sp. WAC05858]